jgi:hypothetical protein
MGWAKSGELGFPVIPSIFVIVYVKGCDVFFALG